MILDSSAIVAVHRKEPGHERLEECILTADFIGIATPTMLESVMVLVPGDLVATPFNFCVLALTPHP